MIKQTSDNQDDKSIWSPPVAFYFQVEFHADPKIPDMAFLEVSGLSMEMETESLKEGGQNDFTYQLPVRSKQGRLILKRSLNEMSNTLEQWIKNNLESGLSKGFTPLNVTVSLINQDGSPVAQWLCDNAYPVKWEISPFNAMKNELVIESLELNYNILSRGK
ncbi:phage tail protein [Bacteroidales bacterium OttesenSCG-928-A17]|nr:phage tail protein [Bacteroidales bacterium OttesenSCG-928-A17]